MVPLGRLTRVLLPAGGLTFPLARYFVVAVLTAAGAPPNHWLAATYAYSLRLLLARKRMSCGAELLGACVGPVPAYMEASVISSVSSRLIHTGPAGGVLDGHGG